MTTISSSDKNDDNISGLYGVDWSERARPTSHSWFPFSFNDLLTTGACTFVSCKEQKGTLIQCGSCSLLVHSHHLTQLNSVDLNHLTPCRPSFTESTTAEGSPYHETNEHVWSDAPFLRQLCELCQRTSLDTNMGGIVCLWCSKALHRACWQRHSDQTFNDQCDFGIYRNLIVRPQWLGRCSQSSSGFKAKLPLDSTMDKAESSSFPYTPVLLFVNKRSGGQVGEKIYREILRKLNPRQVFLLENNSTISHALDIYSSLPNIRICVFGGDGTVGWILGHLAEACPSGNNPPVGICPLGTGNDLARVLAWGEQYEPKNLFPMLLRIPSALPVVLDRWQIQLEQRDTLQSSPSSVDDQPMRFPIGIALPLFLSDPEFVRHSTLESYLHHQKLPNTRFINYMSFGLDAAIALDFHEQRTRDPSKFSSPWKNKLMYFNESFKHFNDFARAKLWTLGSYMRLICDGQDLTDAMSDCHSLIVLNIPGYAAGTDPWGNSSAAVSNKDNERRFFGRNFFDSVADTLKMREFFAFDARDQEQTTGIRSHQHSGQQDFGDRLIEVVGLSTTHMATIHVGFAGKRIAQCRRLRVELHSPMTAQVDGEPFYLSASVAVNIDHAGQVIVLKNRNT